MDASTRKPALAVVYRHPDSLKPYASNPRTHSAAQVAQIAASMTEFGWTNPILVDEDDAVIAGHGRLAAAKLAGIAEVPTIPIKGLSAAQRRALVIADNQLALNAGWDKELLASELLALKVADFNIDLIGFTTDDIAALLISRTVGQTDPDDVPEPPKTPVSEPGDLWSCGSHRILCGDATDKAAVTKVLSSAKPPHLMVTDPPYGVEYDPDWRNRVDRANGKPYGASAVGLVENDGRADWSEAYALFPGDAAYVWHPAGARQVEFYHSLVACGFEIRMQIIWAKSHFPIGRGHYHVQHEPCWYAVRKGKTGHWASDRKQTTLWMIDKPTKSATGHSTQKPVECMRRPIENNSKPGETVYDPFLGSGTTMIAAEMTGRSCLGIEISPAYVDVAVKRWQEFTGQKASNEGTRKVIQ